MALHSLTFTLKCPMRGPKDILDRYRLHMIVGNKPQRRAAVWDKEKLEKLLRISSHLKAYLNFEGPKLYEVLSWLGEARHVAVLSSARSRSGETSLRSLALIVLDKPGGRLWRKENILHDAVTIPNTVVPLGPQREAKLFKHHASTRSKDYLHFPHHLTLHSFSKVE